MTSLTAVICIRILWQITAELWWLLFIDLFRALINQLWSLAILIGAPLYFFTDLVQCEVAFILCSFLFCFPTLRVGFYQFISINLSLICKLSSKTPKTTTTKKVMFKYSKLFFSFTIKKRSQYCFDFKHVSPLFLQHNSYQLFLWDILLHLSFFLYFFTSCVRRAHLSANVHLLPIWMQSPSPACNYSRRNESVQLFFTHQ